MVEFFDDKGERWVVRVCDDDDHCLAVERFIINPSTIERARYGIANGEEESPVDDMHVPFTAISNLLDAMKTVLAGDPEVLPGPTPAMPPLDDRPTDGVLARAFVFLASCVQQALRAHPAIGPHLDRAMLRVQQEAFTATSRIGAALSPDADDGLEWARRAACTDMLTPEQGQRGGEG